MLNIFIATRLYGVIFICLTTLALVDVQFIYFVFAFSSICFKSYYCAFLVSYPTLSCSWKPEYARMSLSSSFIIYFVFDMLDHLFLLNCNVWLILCKVAFIYITNDKTSNTSSGFCDCIP